MTEMLTGPHTLESHLQKQFSYEVTTLGFILPDELASERDIVTSGFYTTSEEYYDAISLHLDHCGYFYQHSETIQNSDRRLEVNQGLLLYAAQLWYTARDYSDCLTTLHYLRADIVHSDNLQHLPFVTDTIVTVTDEYSAAVFARSNPA